MLLVFFGVDGGVLGWGGFWWLGTTGIYGYNPFLANIRAQPQFVYSSLGAYKLNILILVGLEYLLVYFSNFCDCRNLSKVKTTLMIFHLCKSLVVFLFPRD